MVIFLIATLYQLTLPGLHYDEAFEVVPAMQILQSQPAYAFRNSTITLFDVQFPLMTQDYIGTLNTYGVLPFFVIGGINVISMRLYAVFVGGITLLLTYHFTSELNRQTRKVFKNLSCINHKGLSFWTPDAGLIAIALLAVNPTFIFWTRQGIFVTAVGTGIGMGASWCWLRWWRSGSYKFALLGAFLFGLGLYAKLLFIWLIVALFGGFLVARASQAFCLWKNGQASYMSYLGLVLMGMLGCLPLILYNLQTTGTWQSIAQNTTTSYYGTDNTDIFSNLYTRLVQLGTLLDSGHLWYLGNIYTNFLMPSIFLIAFCLSVWLAIKHKNIISLVPFVVIGLVAMQSIVTVSALWITHFAVIMVWPAVAIATVAAQIVRHANAYRVNIIVIVTLILLLITEAKTTWHYHQALTESGGLSDHSDAVYDMATWLEKNADGDVMAMDWGLSASVTFLTHGHVNPIESFGYDWHDTRQFEEMITPHLQSQQKTIFLWRSPDEVIFDRSQNFKALYHPLELEETILEAFYERNGRPVFGATQLVPVGTAENKP